MKRRCWAMLASLLALAFAGIGQAAAQVELYPNRPVRIISDSGAGSAVDVGLRIIAEGLSQRWGQQVLVLNHPGAGGAISARVAAEAAPDGYTLYAPALSAFLTLPGKAANLPLELPRDFAPVGSTADQPMSIGASPTLGISTLPELIALAQKRPGEISYAVTGIGRLTHMLGELLQIRADIKLQVVPYTGGSAHALSDVISGRIPIVIEGYTGLAGAFQSGSIKALAVAAAERLPGLSDLPTVAETFAGFTAAGWQAIVAPRGTPEPIINKVSEDLRKVLDQPEYKDKLAVRGSYARPMTPAEVTAFVRDQQRMWQPALDRIAKLTQ